MKELSALIVLALAYILIKGGAWVLGDALAEAFPIAFTVICVLVIAGGAVFEEGGWLWLSGGYSCDNRMDIFIGRKRKWQRKESSTCVPIVGKRKSASFPSANLCRGNARASRAISPIHGQ